MTIKSSYIDPIKHVAFANESYFIADMNLMVFWWQISHLSLVIKLQHFLFSIYEFIEVG